MAKLMNKMTVAVMTTLIEFTWRLLGRQVQPCTLDGADRGCVIDTFCRGDGFGYQRGDGYGDGADGDGAGDNRAWCRAYGRIYQEGDQVFGFGCGCGYGTVAGAED